MSLGQSGKPPLAKSQNVVPLRDHALQKAVQAIQSPPDGDSRLVLLFLAGPNGAGKSSFFNELDQKEGRAFIFINADLLASLLKGIPAPDHLAQKIADLTREHMLGQKTSFATETVFSDEVGAKLEFLRRAGECGFHVVLVYVALANVHLSRLRVQFRVREKIGHDVPLDKLQRRFIASRENCRRALYKVETSLVLDNSSPLKPLRLMAVVNRGTVSYQAPNMPHYIRELMPLPSSAGKLGDVQAAGT